MKNILLEKNLIIAHRGMHNNLDTPENSINAIKESLKENIPIEIDVQLTKDNQIVVFHDNDLKRMTNTEGLVTNKTLADLKKLKLLNTDESIPTLEEVLKVINNQVLLFIEVKHTKDVKLMCEILIKYLEDYGNYAIKSFDPRIINWLKKHKPDIPRGLIMMKHHKQLKNMIYNNNLIFKYCKPDFISISKGLYKTKKFQKISNKIPTLVWTIKNYSEISDFQKNILGFVCNNLPLKNNIFY